MKKNVFALPMALIAVVCAFALSACGGPSIEQLIREDLTEALGSMNADNEDFLEAIEGSSSGSLEQLGIEAKDFAAAYLDGYAYEVGEITVDDKAGTADAKVKVTIKSVTGIMTDFATRYQEWIDGLDASSLGSMQDAYTKAGELVMDAAKAAESSESEVTFSYEKNSEGTWEPSGDTAAALLGAMR